MTPHTHNTRTNTQQRRPKRGSLAVGLLAWPFNFCCRACPWGIMVIFVFFFCRVFVAAKRREQPICSAKHTSSICDRPYKHPTTNNGARGDVGVRDASRSCCRCGCRASVSANWFVQTQKPGCVRVHWTCGQQQQLPGEQIHRLVHHVV